MTAAGGPIGPGLVLRLGVSQLVCWGITYYLVGVLGDAMGRDLAMSPAAVHAGFSVALGVQGVASPWVGRLTDRRGGRTVMSLGSVLAALGCGALAAARGPALYFSAWAVLGLAMRMVLYEAAFAALVRIGGPEAKRPISQITLLGGLASTTFWPVGHALAARVGWRGTVLAYGAIALLTLPLHLGIPRGAYRRPAAGARPHAPPLATARRDRLLAGALFALIATATTLLNTAMSAHMIRILVGLGVGGAVAVWISTLRGVGQSSARLAEVLFGARITPLQLALLSAALLPVAFASGLYAGRSAAAAIAFALLYGAGNGLSTIARGTLPLVLFDPASYATLTGALLVPSFLLSGIGPLVYALVMQRLGDAAALHLSNGLAAVVLAAAVVLWARFRRAQAASDAAVSAAAAAARRAPPGR